MPGLIRVSEFVEETREDYNSPTTSTFVSRMPQCRQTIASLEEVNEVHQWLFSRRDLDWYTLVCSGPFLLTYTYFDCCYVKNFSVEGALLLFTVFQQVHGVHFDYCPRKCIVTFVSFIYAFA